MHKKKWQTRFLDRYAAPVLKVLVDGLQWVNRKLEEWKSDR